MDSYLIYHPERCKTIIGDIKVYHDKIKKDSNQDPYIWNDKFLHTYCHITQLKNEVGQINFWISGEYPNFCHLYCDCVFVISEKLFWKENQELDITDSIVDNEMAYEHHYKWAKWQHELKRRRRYTLKADSEKSFQPQDLSQNLIDVLPFLNSNGIQTDQLIKSMTSVKGSRPFKLPNGLGQKLYDYLYQQASIKLKGSMLKNIHPNISKF